MNEQVIPWLNKYHGYNIKGEFKFNFSESLTLVEKAAVVADFAPSMNFKKEWVEQTFNVEIESMKQDTTGKEAPAGKKPSASYENSISSYSFECKKCGGSVQEYVNASFLPIDTEETVLMGIYNETFTPDNLPTGLYEEISRYFVRAVDAGFGDPDGVSDFEMYDDLKYSARHFAAAKVYQQVLEMSKIKASDYATFKSQASVIFKQYNETWMQTEFNTARNASRTAKNWQVIQRDKEVNKYLEYQTAGDANVRPEHAALDGITRPVDDRFWSSYYPPNGWNCRCTTISHESAEVTNLKGFVQPDDVPDDFLYNPGKDRTIFSTKHPYFDVENKEFALQNFGLPI
jgi:SPP1 gp7 family putative phage head morphogenesis protein